MDSKLIVKSLIQAIPYVGGSISTLYFDNKDKKKFENLEDFYKNLSIEIEKVKTSISAMESHSQEELIALIEEINEKVENERIQQKKKYYQNLYVKSLIHPVKDCFVERKYFLDLISSLTTVHFDILSVLIHERRPTLVVEFQIPGIDINLLKGFAQQMENAGLVKSQLESMEFTNIGGSMENRFLITELGERFHYFCIQD